MRGGQPGGRWDTKAFYDVPLVRAFLENVGTCHKEIALRICGGLNRFGTPIDSCV